MKPLTKIALAFAAVLGVAVGALFLFRSGEEAAVEALLRQAVDEARTGETDKCIAYVAPDYAFNGENYEQVCSLVRTYVKPGRWKKLELHGITVDVEGDGARAALDFQLEPGEGLTLPYGSFPLRINLTLKKVGPSWKISGYRVDQR